MRALLASIGSRGEIQPMVALALALRAAGHDAVLCAPPNFQEWIATFGLACIPVGLDVQKFVAPSPAPKKRRASRNQWRPLVEQSVRAQFAAVGAAASGCDVIVACGGQLCAGRSIAEARNIGYVYAAYCAGTLPSPAHPPPGIRRQSWPPPINRLLWKASEWSWNGLFRTTVNEQRETLGLMPIESVPKHMFTAEPWLAADALLGPAAATRTLRIVQTGAWQLTTPAALPESVEAFLAAGEPPVYFGFGSSRAPSDTGRTLLAAARAVGRRALLSRSWGDLDDRDSGDDWLALGDVDHAKLFPRCAAIVHHGGAGTTTTAAAGGRPQVVVPHGYDQFYWAQRVRHLGIGVRGPDATRLDTGALTAAVRSALRPEVAATARAVAQRVEGNGAGIAAQRLVTAYD